MRTTRRYVADLLEEVVAVSPKFDTREEYEAWKAERLAKTQAQASSAEEEAGAVAPEASPAATRKQEIEAAQRSALSPEARQKRADARPRVAVRDEPEAMRAKRFAESVTVEMRAAIEADRPANSVYADEVPGVGMLTVIAMLNLIGGVLLGLVFLFMAGEERGDDAAVYAIIGIAVFLEGLLFYGFVRVFTTIAEEARRIRRALEARPTAGDR
jgi:hypothetical protein